MTAQGAKDAIAALRRSHDRLSDIAANADPAALSRQSGSSEWTVADVLGHLGSASEIALATLRAGQADRGAAPAVWDRWNAMSPPAKAASFVTASARFVDELDGLSDAELTSKRIDMVFLPAPVDVEYFVRLRLNEIALHGWDIDVASDPTAVLDPRLVPAALRSMYGFVGFVAKPGGTSGTVEVVLTDLAATLTLRFAADGTTLEESPAADAGTRISMPAEAFVRLIAGRLSAEHTPASVTVEGDLSLDDLRRAFPGL